MKRMSKRALSLALCAFMLLGAGLAAADDHDLLLAYEPMPLEWPTLQDLLPIDGPMLSPDHFVSVLMGELEYPALATVFEQLGFTLSQDAINIRLPDGGSESFTRSAAHIWREPFDNLSTGDSLYDVELVCYGTASGVHYSFVFLRKAGEAWVLIDCVPNFSSVRLESNSQVVWLVGQGTSATSDETVTFETWYNPVARHVDLRYAVSGNRIASLEGGVRHDALILSRAIRSTHVYWSQEAGRNVDETTIRVVKYLCLSRLEPLYGGDGETDSRLTQADACQQVALYKYDEAMQTLTLQAIWTYEDASPALLEGPDWPLMGE